MTENRLWKQSLFFVIISYNSFLFIFYRIQYNFFSAESDTEEEPPIMGSDRYLREHLAEEEIYDVPLEYLL